MVHPKGFRLKDMHVAFNKKAASRIRTYLVKRHKKGITKKKYKVTTSKHTAKGRTGYVVTEWMK